MVSIEEFEVYVRKLSPFTLKDCIPPGEVYRNYNLGLFEKYIDYVYNDENANKLKKTNLTRYIQLTAKNTFALGLYECLQRIPDSWSDKDLTNCVRFLVKHGVWKNAFEGQEIDEEFDISARIAAYQDNFIISFPNEVRDNNYLKIYLKQYYSIGWNFGNKLIIGI